MYRAPCGVMLKTYDEIHAYVMETNMGIPIDFFSFDPTIDGRILVESSACLELHTDISIGKEWTPIKCVNWVDTETPPQTQYITTMIPGPGITFMNDDGFISSCDCTDDCQDKESCSCWKLTFSGFSFKINGNRNKLKGYENRRLENPVCSGIFECNQKCKCRSTCLNRVAQNKLLWKLELFKTVNKGWGVRASQDIPRGSFICVYAGVIRTGPDANKRFKKDDYFEYLVNLDFIDCNKPFKEGYESDVTDIEVEEAVTEGSNAAAKRKSTFYNLRKRKVTGEKSTENLKVKSLARKKQSPLEAVRKYFGKHSVYVVDAKDEGNIGRYFNHSCNPNVFAQHVFIDYHDQRFPLIAFFTSRNIKAGTELNWKYGYEIGSVPGKAIVCNCGESECDGRIL